MKIFLFALITFLFSVQTLLAQANKPETGTWGIGFGVDLDGQGSYQNLMFSRMLNDGLEAGTEIGFQYYHAANQSSDSAVAGGINGSIWVTETNTSKNSSFNFSFSPFLLKHLNITSNLDCYFGPILPIRLGTRNASSYTNEFSGTNYFSSVETTTKTPGSNSVGLGLVLGSRFFFYHNLAIGATYNLTGAYSFQNGDVVTNSTYSNSGSDNPSTGADSNFTTSSKMKSTRTTIGTSSNFGLNLTFYFD